jgi:peptidoglycan-N-acetylglucosamine deacetylase
MPLQRYVPSPLFRRARTSALGFAYQQRRLRRAARAGHGGALVRAGSRLGGRRWIALTYDDGPSTANTPVLLDILAQHDARATFFMLGSNAADNPELARRVVAAGHEVGNHFFSHRDPLSLSADELHREFLEGAEAIERAAGVRPVLVRPPHGRRAADLVELAERAECATVLWSLDSGDTVFFDASRVAREVVDRARPGDIVLMHDGAAARPATTASTSVILDELGRQGYAFVTVSELLAASRVGRDPS